MILVTGGTGLIGSHLLAHLSSEQGPVRAIFRNESSLEKTKLVFRSLGIEARFENIDWVKADLLDLFSLEQAFDGVDYVYHSAAMVSFAAKDADDLMRCNIEGTANVVNLALEKGIKKMAYLSSVAALGSAPNEQCSNENSPWENTKSTSAYSISKYYAENEVWRGSAEGLPVVIVNPSTVIGFGDWTESSSTIIKKVYEGLKFYPGGSNGFIGVDDVVKSLLHLMESDIQNERYLLVSENLSFKALFDCMAMHLNKEKPRHFISEKWAKLAFPLVHLWSILRGKKNLISAASITSAYRKRCYSNEKATEVLPFEFEKMDSVIQRSAQHYLQFQNSL